MKDQGLSRRLVLHEMNEVCAACASLWVASRTKVTGNVPVPGAQTWQTGLRQAFFLTLGGRTPVAHTRPD